MTNLTEKQQTLLDELLEGLKAIPRICWASMA